MIADIFNKTEQNAGDIPKYRQRGITRRSVFIPRPLNIRIHCFYQCWYTYLDASLHALLRQSHHLGDDKRCFWITSSCACLPYSTELISFEYEFMRRFVKVLDESSCEFKTTSRNLVRVTDGSQDMLNSQESNRAYSECESEMPPTPRWPVLSVSLSNHSPIGQANHSKSSLLTLDNQSILLSINQSLQQSNHRTVYPAVLLSVNEIKTFINPNIPSVNSYNNTHSINQSVNQSTNPVTCP